MSGQSQTVLILDDDADVRGSLIEFFEDREWRVFWAATAEDALETLRRERIDGVVVDIRLPGMDGNGFIRSASKIYPNLAYLICTGSPEYHPPDDILALPNVCEQVFSKPVFDLFVLEDKLREILLSAK